MHIRSMRLARDYPRFSDRHFPITASHTNVTPYLLVFFPGEVTLLLNDQQSTCSMHRRLKFGFSVSTLLLHLPRFNLNGLPTIVFSIGRRILYVLLARLAEYHVQDRVVGNLVIGQSRCVGERLGPLLGVGGVDPHLCGWYGGR